MIHKCHHKCIFLFDVVDENGMLLTHIVVPFPVISLRMLVDDFGDTANRLYDR